MAAGGRPEHAGVLPQSSFGGSWAEYFAARGSSRFRQPVADRSWGGGGQKEQLSEQAKGRRAAAGEAGKAASGQERRQAGRRRRRQRREERYRRRSRRSGRNRQCQCEGQRPSG